MEDAPLIKQINYEIESFRSKQIQIVPGLGFNQWEVLQRIYFYYNSRFSRGGGSLDPVDDDGDRMYFYNIVKNPCKVFSKAIDFDTKNIKLLTTGGGDPGKTWYMERDLKFWMRDKQFGRVLNRIFKELPIFGSVVLKIVNGTPYFVDLRNFVVEQSADSLDDSNYIIEVHNLTIPQFRKVAKDMGWDKTKVNQTIQEFRNMKDISHIRLYERYGEVGKLNDGGNMDYTYRRVFIADVGVDEYDQRGELKAEHSGVELSSEEWDGHPYWEFHAEKESGRWLGIGVVETLFEPQIRHNQLANLQSKASYWMALHVFQTRDQAFNRNLSTDARNGEVLTTDSEVTEVVISDRNLAHFSEEYRKWMSNRDEMTFAYDSVQGERSPAGTTATEIQSNVSQNLSHFAQIQEEVALGVKELIYEVIIPNFQKEKSAEHKLRLVGQDLDEYAEMIKNDLVNREIIRMAVASTAGRPFPSEEDRLVVEQAVLEAIKQGKEKLLDVPKGFYKDVKYDVDIDITGESIDTRVRQATVFSILQALVADPTMTQDPMKKKALFWIAENGGISPTDLFGSESRVEPMAQMGQMGGGGVSAPQLGTSVPGQQMATV